MLKGIDISSYQNGLKLQKNNEYDFVILRGGFTGWGTGVNYNKDTCFEDFYKQCKNNNIPVGCYWYSCADNYEKGINEANFLYNNCLKGKQFEYPIYIDIEDTHHQIKTKRGTTDAIKGFCETLEKLGYYVGIYANSNWFKNYIYTDELNRYDKWLAQWTTNRPTFMSYGLWQNSDSGNVLGYKIDTDISYIDYPNLIKSKGFNGYSNSPNTNQNTSNNSNNNTNKTITIGTKVKTTQTGNGASDGSSNTARSGITGKVSRIIKDAKYPYLVSNNSIPIGWYKESALNIIG